MEGLITAPIIVGPISIMVEFAVVDIPVSYELIVGQTWVNDMQAVTSTRHQCLTFPHDCIIVKIMGERN